MSSFEVGKNKNPKTLRNHILNPSETDFLLRFLSLEKLNKNDKSHLQIFILYLCLCFQLEQYNKQNK